MSGELTPAAAAAGLGATAAGAAGAVVGAAAGAVVGAAGAVVGGAAAAVGFGGAAVGAGAGVAWVHAASSPAPELRAARYRNRRREASVRICSPERFACRIHPARCYKRAPMFQQTRLGLAEAERARSAILAALTPTDAPIALAIADEHGVPILLLR